MLNLDDFKECCCWHFYSTKTIMLCVTNINASIQQHIDYMCAYDTSSGLQHKE